MKQGMIAIVVPDLEGQTRKVFDLKITNTWPLISIAAKGSHFFRDWSGKITEVEPYQHISIPPSLDIHLTRHGESKEHKFLHKDLVNPTTGELKFEFVYLIGLFSQPINFYKPLDNIKRYQADIVVLMPGQNNTFTEKTGIFVEFFVHQKPNEKERIMQEPFLDNSEMIGGINSIQTYWFRDLIREQKPTTDPKFYASFRYGFWKCSQNQSFLLIKPLT